MATKRDEWQRTELNLSCKNLPRMHSTGSDQPSIFQRDETTASRLRTWRQPQSTPEAASDRQFRVAVWKVARRALIG